VGSRRKGREAALQILFQMETGDTTAAQAIRYYYDNFAPTREGEDFATAIVTGCADSLGTIDERIRGVSENWRLERMSRVDRNILRLAAYELLHMADVPRRVTLNEAVELAKRYGSEGSPGFVNGVLDRIASDAGKS
jgi:N utilization substance protein B